MKINKKLVFGLVLLSILVSLASVVVSASLCKSSDGYYNDCSYFNHRYTGDSYSKPEKVIFKGPYTNYILAKSEASDYGTPSPSSYYSNYDSGYYGTPYFSGGAYWAEAAKGYGYGYGYGGLGDWLSYGNYGYDYGFGNGYGGYDYGYGYDSMYGGYGYDYGYGNGYDSYGYDYGYGSYGFASGLGSILNWMYW